MVVPTRILTREAFHNHDTKHVVVVFNFLNEVLRKAISHGYRADRTFVSTKQKGEKLLVHGCFTSLGVAGAR